MDQAKGELMALRNFASIENDTLVKPEDVKNYLLSVAKLNPRKEKKQFHAAISCNGRKYDKYQLTDVAHEWIKRMGYGDNPYIIVYHNDTENNHVHIVSSRINVKTGESIPDSFENVRAVKFIDQIIKEKYGVDRELKEAEFSKYNVTTLAQLKLLYEVTGHSFSEKDGNLSFYKRDILVNSCNIADVSKLIKSNKEDKKRADQLKAIFKKYLPDFDGSLNPVHQNLSGQRAGKLTGYHSDFTGFMRERFGLQFVFHFKDDKPPYGYSVIDHKGRSVFKGSSIMKLAELTKSPDHRVKLSYLEKQALLLSGYNTESINHIKLLSKKFKVPMYRVPISDRTLSKEEISYYKDLLRLYLKNNDVSTLGNLNMEMAKENGKWFVIDHGGRTILDADDVMSSDDIRSFDRDQEVDLTLDISALNPIGGMADMAATIAPDNGDDPNKRKRKKR
ncbi:MAG: relaxase/mobilization nuclease domain-containing protein [Olivibacter sp.]|nr:relaxase/mobilization nuclease domain-containing protein [Olivibacter sp. UJ_SKK_5.1]